jgi:spermidine/putrescine transport system substrate-binding protein
MSLSRRALLRRAGGLALTAGGAGALAGCENSTTPAQSTPTSGASGGDGGGGGGQGGILGDPTAGGPVDAVGIPLARRDYPVTLPRLGDPVKSGTAAETGGELKVYNYADYLNPAVLKEFSKREGVEVKVTTFDTLEEAFSKLTSGLEFDVIFSVPDQVSKLVGRELVQPLNYELLGNLEKNIWPELHSPAYDVGPRYTVPYIVYSTGIGWRRDKLDFDPSKLDQPWDAFWNAEKYRGRVAVLDDKREALGMALMRSGVTNLNTEDPALLERASKDLQELKDIGIKVSISDYETLPAGRIFLHQSWSGDLISAVLSYLPEGTKPDVLGYWQQPEGGPIFNDCICVGAKAAKPVMAHRFMNFMMDSKVAYENFAGYVGYQPPQNSIDPSVLFDRGIVPETLRQTVVTREAFQGGNAYLTLTAEGDQLWNKAWTDFRGG